MQHFDMESTVFERGGSLLYISVKKSFSTFLSFFPILAYISLSVVELLRLPFDFYEGESELISALEKNFFTLIFGKNPRIYENFRLN